MKLPFYTVLGPLVWSSQHIIRKICDNPLLKYSKGYAILLGLIGTFLSIHDIWRIIHCGQRYLTPKTDTNKPNKGQKLNPEVQRDIKLIGLTVSAEYYIFILIGNITVHTYRHIVSFFTIPKSLFTILQKNPVFFLPYLLVYSVVFILELLVAGIKLLIGDYTFRKYWLWSTLIMIINWISVFRTFIKLTTSCDF